MQAFHGFPSLGAAPSANLGADRGRTRCRAIDKGSQSSDWKIASPQTVPLNSPLNAFQRLLQAASREWSKALTSLRFRSLSVAVFAVALGYVFYTRLVE
jgi:hypothetical protein